MDPGRPQQFYGTGTSGAAAGPTSTTDAYGNVQFSNPWSGPGGARAGAVNPTSAPYGLPATTMAPQSDLSALRAPLRQNSVSTSFENLALAAPLVSRSMSSQNPLYATDNFSGTAGFGTTYPDTQSATVATTSPTAGGATYAAINGYGAYDNGSNKNLYSLPNLSLPEDHRRLSHASLASSTSSIMDSPLDPLRQRQSSLVDYTRGGLTSSYPSAEIDSARGMVHLSQNATRFSIPNGHRSSSSASSSSYYPHSTSSSISSASSYPYYGAGSIDSTGADLSGIAGMYEDPSRPSLPRPHALLHTMGHNYPATQQQMMHSFNSKVQQNTTKKHKCKVCDKRFTRPSSLQTHMYSHTGEKPFACEVEGCGRQFSVVSNLRRHRKVHKGHSDTETISNAGSV